ncbi:hypothetical protein SUSAZ_07700 [Sulfolobus acidocaldarius SUSAZ]|nr:hypothetical protein SUSAZ_07700 [Sulfolobus acidocaldarius SUSAZ]
MDCYIYYENRKCVEICGKVVCDKATVEDYGAICEKCANGDKKSCIELYNRFGCWSITGWWL